ncbi:hypothetical protein HU200_057634 [Digitaria exilis]|uniref:Uncharacterized protein n=1 Tax=Digitaria exilis TaxID=1010633 RepID=A0A835AH26_9POAL|nr:hypothetical protein HU200_057634 [Digitaria exilis]
MSTSRGTRAGEFAANEPAPDAAATMAVTVVQTPSALLGEARHVRIQDRVSTTKRPSSHRLTTTEAQEDTLRLEEATRSDVESGGSNNQGSKKTRKMRLLLKRVGVAIWRFASFRRRKVKCSESEPSDEDEVDSKKCTQRIFMA